MLSSITPLGERGRGAVWGRTVTAYVVASSLAGLLMGLSLGFAGSLTGQGGRFSFLVLGLVCFVGLALDRNVGGLHLPTITHQVNRHWMMLYRDWVYGAGFGFQLGLGIGTIVVSSSVYLVLVAEFASGSLAAGALIGSAFGVLRGLTLALGKAADTPDELFALHQWLEEHRGRAMQFLGLIQLFAGVFAIVVALVFILKGR
jgi:hypothetical protein